MKRRITRAQLNELTHMQQEQLRAWWQPEFGDWCVFLDSEELVTHRAPDFDLKTKESYVAHHKAYPLLTIDQMLTFLCEKKEVFFSTAWYYNFNKQLGDYTLTWNADFDLCAILWQGVKEALRNSE